MYIKTRNAESFIVSIWVDDIMYTGSSDELIAEFKVDGMKKY